MKTQLASLAAVASMLSAGTAIGADLTVNLTGIRSDAGSIQIGVANSADAYDGKAKLVTGKSVVPDKSGKTTATFSDVAPGRYAVMVTHDENGNGKLDTNLIGMPIEGYGFSNNPNVMRKPTWDEAAFEVDADGQSITIELR